MSHDLVRRRWQTASASTYRLIPFTPPYGLSVVAPSLEASTRTAQLYMLLNPVVSSTCVYDPTALNAPLTLPKGYNGAAVGKGRQLAKTELEKLKLSELTTREAVFEAARM